MIDTLIWVIIVITFLNAGYSKLENDNRESIVSILFCIFALAVFFFRSGV